VVVAGMDSGLILYIYITDRTVSALIELKVKELCSSGSLVLEQGAYLPVMGH